MELDIFMFMIPMVYRYNCAAFHSIPVPPRSAAFLLNTNTNIIVTKERY